MNAHKLNKTLFWVLVSLMLLATLALSACANASQESVNNLATQQAETKREIEEMREYMPDRAMLESVMDEARQEMSRDVLANIPTQQPVPSAEEIAKAVPPVDEDAIARKAVEEVMKKIPSPAAPPVVIMPAPAVSPPLTTTVTGSPILASEVYTGSLPNVCLVDNTTQEDIDGQLLKNGADLYENSALGADSCATAFEGRWYEGFPPSEDHHITAFFSAVENASVFQGSQWIIPVGTEVRDILWGLAKGKCDNWKAAKVEAEPLVFDYVDLSTSQIVHQDSTCAEVAAGNPLPATIGLVPGDLIWGLPHFSITGGGWGTTVQVSNVVTTTGAITATATITGTPATPAAPPVTAAGMSKFDEVNKNLTCSTQPASLGNNAAGVGAVDSQWDSNCVYLLDGKVNGQRAIGLIRGVDLSTAAASYDASIWPVPASWVGVSWAKDFSRDNCGTVTSMPIMVFENGTWSLLETYACPAAP